MSKILDKDNLLTISFYIFITICSVICILPFWLVIASSITHDVALLQNGYNLIPAKISFDAYKLILKTNTVFGAYKVTIFVTVIGTLLSLLLTSAMAYGISSKKVKYRNHIAFLVYFTMLFHGGLVSSYILTAKYLHLKDNIWVLIIPALINPWNMFLLRNFFKSIPESLSESAKIDGANDLYILYKIILPLSLPAIATIGLFYALAYWNEWFRALLYINDKKLFPLQYIIMKIIRNTDLIQQGAAEAGIMGLDAVPTYSTRMATAVVTIGPIIFLYPFIQKYFVKGLTVGSVKG